MGGVEKCQPLTKCFCNGAMTSWYKVLSSLNAIVSWDRTRLRKGTTAETQTLWPIGLAPWTVMTKPTKFRPTKIKMQRDP